MIGTDDPIAPAAAPTGVVPVEQARRAMSADVIEGPQPHILAADDEDRAADEVESLVVSGLGEVALVTDDLPRWQQDLFDLPLEELGIAVDPPGQAEDGPASGRHVLRQSNPPG
jgi:hypothetical protein